MDNKDWKIIISHFDLNERVQIGVGNYPKLINQEVKYFDSKEELIKPYRKMIDRYIKISYDWKSHGQGAMKFYYDKDEKEIYTLILVHYKNNEVTEGLFE